MRPIKKAVYSFCLFNDDIIIEIDSDEAIHKFESWNRTLNHYVVADFDQLEEDMKERIIVACAERLAEIKAEQQNPCLEGDRD